jgi:hypothetical protein
MQEALKRGKGTNGKIPLYLTGAGILGDAMGEAADGKGFDAGRQFVEPSKGELRVDMSEQEIRTPAWLADIGFHHVIEGTTSPTSIPLPTRKSPPMPSKYSKATCRLSKVSTTITGTMRRGIGRRRSGISG